MLKIRGIAQAKRTLVRELAVAREDWVSKPSAVSSSSGGRQANGT